MKIPTATYGKTRKNKYGKNTCSNEGPNTMDVVLKRYLRNLERICTLRIYVRYLSFYHRPIVFFGTKRMHVALVWNFCSQCSYFLSPNNKLRGKKMSIFMV